ncbi:MAG TPA: ACT domain-containing protein, partial [Novosphingobium sp.]|nr:ACT domain-containing protein [Novosphingobium sp.]
MTRNFILRIVCNDRPGIVARVSSYLAALGCNILDAQQFEDRRTRRFFMRVVFDPASHDIETL